MNLNPGTYHRCDDMRARFTIRDAYCSLELFGTDCLSGRDTELTLFMERPDNLEALAGAINAIQDGNEIALLESLAKSLAGRAETALLSGAILRAIGQHSAEALMADPALSSIAAE
jgi:hypothetical protein